MFECPFIQAPCQVLGVTWIRHSSWPQWAHSLMSKTERSWAHSGLTEHRCHHWDEPKWGRVGKTGDTFGSWTPVEVDQANKGCTWLPRQNEQHVPSWEAVRRHDVLVIFQAAWETGACRANDPRGPVSHSKGLRHYLRAERPSEGVWAVAHHDQTWALKALQW